MASFYNSVTIIKAMIMLMCLMIDNKVCRAFTPARTVISSITRCSQLKNRSGFLALRAAGFGSKIPNDGVTGMPSIDQLAKQHQLNTLMGEYGESKEKKVFEDKLDYPTYFLFKIVGVNDPDFVNDIVATVTDCVGVQPRPLAYSLKETAGGKYTSITIKPFFEDSKQLYAVYDAVSKDERVKFML
mmetsp:Transcript_16361/g.27654  ORF Transcript_16361/g.27654 Transcript_16361/m.27654 type:complete len:186 (-) Transcript_16361:3085-3642(-)